MKTCFHKKCGVFAACKKVKDFFDTLRRDRSVTPFFLSVSGSQDDAYQCCDHLCENCAPPDHYLAAEQRRQSEHQNKHEHCLLYTSDAADDTPCVDLGGRRIIK